MDKSSWLVDRVEVAPWLRKSKMEASWLEDEE